MKSVEISIIIVNYNTGKELFECISSIKKGKLGVSYEIIIIDNASKKGDLDKVKENFEIRLVKNVKNVGFARGVNQGIYRSRGKYIVILNPDTIVERDAIQILLNYMKSLKNAGCVAPQIFYPDKRPQPSVRRFPTLVRVFFGRRSIFTRLFPTNSVTREYLCLDMDYTRVQKVEWVTGACLMTSKDVLREVGVFDERFFLFVEDADFCYRLKEHRYSIYYIPEAHIIHSFGAATERFWRRATISHNLGMFLFFSKHNKPNIIMGSLLAFGLAVRVFYILMFYTLRENFKGIVR